MGECGSVKRGMTLFVRDVCDKRDIIDNDQHIDIKLISHPVVPVGFPEIEMMSKESENLPPCKRLILGILLRVKSTIGCIEYCQYKKRE